MLLYNYIPYYASSITRYDYYYCPGGVGHACAKFYMCTCIHVCVYIYIYIIERDIIYMPVIDIGVFKLYLPRCADSVIITSISNSITITITIIIIIIILYGISFMYGQFS